MSAVLFFVSLRFIWAAFVQRRLFDNIICIYNNFGVALTVNAGLVVSLDLCGRLAEVVDILLPVHVVYAVLKESICTLLTSLYTTLNAVVKLVGYSTGIFI